MKAPRIRHQLPSSAALIATLVLAALVSACVSVNSGSALPAGGESDTPGSSPNEHAVARPDHGGARAAPGPRPPHLGGGGGGGPASGIPLDGRPMSDRTVAMPPIGTPMTAAPAALPMQMAPEPAAQSAPEIASPRAQVSNALQALETANFAFNAPATLELNSTAQIQLRLSLAESIEQLKAELTAEGERVGDVVKVSDRVEARLSGMNFEINAITEPTQPLGVNDTLEWSWDVKPVEEGEQKLHLTLTALMSVNGKDIGRTVRTLDKTIVVQVSAVNRASLLFGKYWQWLMTAVFIPLFGWGVKKLRGRTAAQPAAAHSL